ncbi:alpha/beta hydrolase [Mycolicibacterium llatzerense]|uniref:alpha/beta hydrolase n=1 Tax=Mycolicibacterium llatzerense TaxID=280871 RepID=UPI0021B5760D|nr:alpha/beta hydrolase [Mycolicibacterium llatzerense]MCT7364389.1 hypothetical protein [Mycolicibacterium llatzerense]
MTLPPDAVSIRRPSRTARVIHAVAGALTQPAVRFVTSTRGRPVGERLAAAGRTVRKLSRLQRVRPIGGIQFARYSHDDVPIEMIRTAQSRASLSDGVIFYLHGGGFFCGNLDSHLHVVVALARRTQVPVVHVDYRQHPDTRIDGSIQDCLSAYRWLLEQGADPEKVVFAGDSAGGFLAFATVLAAQQDGLPTPAGVVGISPLLELDNTARNTHENVTRDPLRAGPALTVVLECTRPDSTMFDPSPVSGSLEAFPPALIIVAESEILRCDAERMYETLTRAGRSCTVRAWTHQLHAFPALLPFLPESKEAFDCIVQFIRTRLSASTSADRSRQDAPGCRTTAHSCVSHSME